MKVATVVMTDADGARLMDKLIAVDGVLCSFGFVTKQGGFHWQHPMGESTRKGLTITITIPGDSDDSPPPSAL